jgi:hypothetical protein
MQPDKLTNEELILKVQALERAVRRQRWVQGGLIIAFAVALIVIVVGYAYFTSSVSSGPRRIERAVVVFSDDKSVEILCPHCQTRLRIPSKYSGWQGKCPACGGDFILPEAKKKDNP